jgi:hypothetical protein
MDRLHTFEVMPVGTLDEVEQAAMRRAWMKTVSSRIVPSMPESTAFDELAIIGNLRTEGKCCYNDGSGSPPVQAEQPPCLHMVCCKQSDAGRMTNPGPRPKLSLQIVEHYDLRLEDEE